MTVQEIMNVLKLYPKDFQIKVLSTEEDCLQEYTVSYIACDKETKTLTILA